MLAVAAGVTYACWPKRGPTSADLRAHPVKQSAWWERFRGKPLVERIFAAPAELADYLALDNQVHGFAAVPAQAPLTSALQAEINQVLTALPPAVRAQLDPRLLGVFVVRELGTSGYTDIVRDERGAPVGAFIVLNVDALALSANRWLAWKEATPFVAAPGFTIEGTLEAPETDTPQGSLEFLLLHELGHVMAINSYIHPDWAADHRKVDLEDYDFAPLSWQGGLNDYARKNPHPPPGPIRYYSNNPDRPLISQAGAYYVWLEATDYPTLYAATNVFDDFAESFATYIHTEVYGKPFEIRIKEGETVVRTMPVCWKMPRCAAKRKVLEEILGIP